MTVPRLASLLASLYMTFALPAASFGAQGDCGQPVSAGAGPVSTDALFTLRAAVAIVRCAPAVCDVDGNCRVTSGDALRILKSAVGEDIELDCTGQCQVTTTSSTSSSSLFGSTTSTTTSTSMPAFLSTTSTSMPARPSTTTTSTLADTTTTTLPAIVVTR